MSTIVVNITLAFIISLLQFFYIKLNKLINDTFIAHGYIAIIFIIMLFIETTPLLKILFLVILWLLTEYKPLIYIFNMDQSTRLYLIVFSTMLVLMNTLF
ncbi:membrane protein (plasmid) [Aliivibrio wodanis]|uniref:Membrane protein n=1 Tax=Aliivibrio wodanis TaxID=80852 RepID=A0A090I8N1_9GAMM|nr:membrane protein [Aliivibrio wodanis]